VHRTNTSTPVPMIWTSLQSPYQADKLAITLASPWHFIVSAA
jgi:hypothetical protein